MSNFGYTSCFCCGTSVFRSVVLNILVNHVSKFLKSVASQSDVTG